ncbi:MAG: hybrid sensor histidine kinase/response regulator [Aridibacter sp.]
MDSKILKGFIDETENYLPTIRGGILLCSRKEGSCKEELTASINGLHKIRTSAEDVGLDEIGKTAGELEQSLEFTVREENSLSDTKAREYLDLLVKLETFISELKFGMDEFEFDASSFIEKSFANFEPNKNIPEQEIIEETKKESFEDFGDFEIDDEMLEIFAMEAEDHLKNIGQNLEILEKDVNNTEALLEIRRSSHTLKGSAGIVGLKQLSNLAHRVEDLLDYISENKIESNEEIFNLLLAATDCLNDITNGEKSPEFDDKLGKLHGKFDYLLRHLEKEDVAEASKPLNLPGIEPKIEKTIEPVIGQKFPSPAQSRSIVRVSLEKLDDLVKLVSEMVFSRSVFEQRLFELEKQIEELQLTTRRLQRSTGKLETDFEAGMMGNNSFSSYGNVQPNRFNSFGYNPEKSPDTPEFDTLEFDRYTDFHQTTRELLESTGDTFAINSELDTLYSFLELLFDNQKRLIDEMQDKLLSLRMVSFGTLSARLQRTVRVTAEEERKSADLSITGENIEVDTQILDSLVEPLLHLLRNAVAHGIEPPETRRLLGKEENGKISLKVYNEGTHIILTVSDDGRGISKTALKEKAVSLGLISSKKSEKMTDEDALSLVFLPGLTTAEEISQVSGRGVGMNIVKTNISRQQGTISIDSIPQKGTTFTIRIPMALAVTRSLLVQANGQKFAFPIKLVKHISEISPAALEKAQREKTIRLGDVTYAVSHLNELLGLPVTKNFYENDFPLMILDTVKKPCALIVDKIIKPEEIVIKPLGKPLEDLPDLLGATILGDGSVVPVLDLAYLLDEQKPESKYTKSFIPEPQKTQLNILIVDDSPSVRHINSRLVTNNGWNPIIAKDGLEALEFLQTANNLPDIILTDVEMPQMDGYELLASLKRNQILRKIPVVMITSRAGDKHRRKAFELGVSEYLTKPYEDLKLVEIIRMLTKAQGTYL